jgi:hypothetical protein
VERTLLTGSIDIAVPREVVQADVEGVIAPLSGTPGTIWVAFNYTLGADGTLALTRLDAMLAQELARQVFHSTGASERFPELYRFQRPREVQ